MPRTKGKPVQETIETRDGRMVLKSGGGCLSLFGLPFLAAGIFITLVALGVVKPQNADRIQGWSHFLFFLMGLAFTAVGGGLTLGRKWVVIDKDQGTVRTSWGLLAPMKSQEALLSSYEAVCLRLQQGDSDSPDTYPVELAPKDGGKALALASGPDYAQAYAKAEAAARFLGLALRDKTGGGESEVAPQELGLGYGERVRGGEEERPRVSRPPEMKSRVTREGRGVRIEIPGPSFGAGMLLPAAIPIAIAAWFGRGLADFFHQTETPPFVEMFFLGFLFLFFVLVPLVGLLKNMLRTRMNRTVVSAGAKGIALEERDLWKVKTTEIPASDIVGLDAPDREKAVRHAALTRRPDGRPGAFRGEPPAWLKGLARLVKTKGVAVRSRKGIFFFGAGLSEAELGYLRSLVVEALGQ